ISFLTFFGRDWEAALADRDRFPLPWVGATSAHASRSAPAAAEEALAFATESSLASTDAALPIPLDKIVRPLGPLPLASSAPWPFGLFFAFMRVFRVRRPCLPARSSSNQFARCDDGGGSSPPGRSGKPCRHIPSIAPWSALV